MADPRFDNPALWTENLAQPVSVQEFQKEIDKLFGFEPITRRSWLRLTWMPTEDRDEFGEPLAYDWDEYGDGGRGMWRRRYLWSADVSYVECRDEKTGLFYAKEVWNDVSPPRFILERFIPPSIALRDWKHQGVDADGMKWTSRCPIFGLYEGLAIMPYISTLLQGGVFTTHKNNCCQHAKREERDCYGYYTEPSLSHLTELRRLNALRQRLKEDRPGISTEAQHNDARKRSRERDQRTWEKFGNKVGQIWYEGLRTHRARMSADPSVVSHGLYHFLKENPLAKPKENKIITDV